MYVRNYNGNTTLSHHWKTSDRFRKGLPTIIALNFGNSGGALYGLSDKDSSMINKTTYDWNDGMGAFKLYTYGLGQGELGYESGENNPMIMRYIFPVPILLLFLAACLTGDAEAGIASVSTISILLYISHYAFDLFTPELLLANFAFCIVLSVAAFSFFRTQKPHFMVSKILLAVMLLMYHSTGQTIFTTIVVSILLIPAIFIVRIKKYNCKMLLKFAILIICVTLSILSISYEFPATVLYDVFVQKFKHYAAGTNMESFDLLVIVPAIASLPIFAFYVGLCFCSSIIRKEDPDISAIYRPAPNYI